MRSIVAAITLLAISLFFNQAAHADSIRCGNKLASTGATLYEVKSICGAPDDAQHRTESHTISERVSAPCDPPEKKIKCSSTVSSTVYVEVDEWTYDFGTNQFLRFLRFEDGRLISIHDGDYGKKNIN